MHATLEFACLDLVGKFLNQPLQRLLGGKLRDQVPFASYLFWRLPNTEGAREIRTIEQLLQHAQELKAHCGFCSHKLKGGAFQPEYELEAYRALAAAFPDDSLRYNPNAALSVTESIWLAEQIRDLCNDYLEDPTWGLQGMRQVREPRCC